MSFAFVRKFPRVSNFTRWSKTCQKINENEFPGNVPRRRILIKWLTIHSWDSSFKATEPFTALTPRDTFFWYHSSRKTPIHSSECYEIFNLVVLQAAVLVSKPKRYNLTGFRRRTSENFNLISRLIISVCHSSFLLLSFCFSSSCSLMSLCVDHYYILL